MGVLVEGTAAFRKCPRERIEPLAARLYVYRYAANLGDIAAGFSPGCGQFGVLLAQSASSGGSAEAGLGAAGHMCPPNCVSADAV